MSQPSFISSVTISTTTGNRGLVATGRFAIGEKVRIVLKNCRAFIGKGLRIDFLDTTNDNTLIACFPLLETDGWIGEGNDAVCVVNFSTTAAKEMFAGLPLSKVSSIFISITCDEPDSLIASGSVTLSNNYGSGNAFDISIDESLYHQLKQRVEDAVSEHNVDPNAHPEFEQLLDGVVKASAFEGIQYPTPDTDYTQLVAIFVDLINRLKGIKQ